MTERYPHRRLRPGSALPHLATLALVALTATVLGPESARGADDGDRSAEAIPSERTGDQPGSTAAPAENGDEPTKLSDVFPWTGERFVYSLRVNGSEAMRAALQVGDLRRNGKLPYIPVGLSVHSFGFFDNVYPVDDRADTYINPITLQPFRSEKYFRESGKVRTYIVDYAHDRYSAKVEKSKPGRTHTFENAIPATTHDMITWLYHLRRRGIEMGETYRYFVYDGWKLSDVHMEVVAKEDLLTPAGWFKAWKIRFVRKIVDSQKNEQGGLPTAPVLRLKNPSDHSGHFWLSRDENHLPLRVTIPTKFGAGEAVLLDYHRPDHQ